jgi:hypothetical protein
MGGLKHLPHTAAELPAKGAQFAFCTVLARETNKGGRKDGGQRIDYLACPLTGHISKGHAQGVYGINAPVLGRNVAAGEGKEGGQRNRPERTPQG